MACNCFEKISNDLDQRFREAVKENCVEVVESEFENHGFVIAKGDWSPIYLKYIFRYRKAKKNGSPEVRCTNLENSVFMSYCPFCGTKFEGEDGKNAEIQATFK
ncbi:hypothetical protein [Serratia symbiotica]|uniref:hypothetical protein n=1 Tax=Serratia symbiotica TaxID=138074 RepID=UPI00135FAA08|nr:hypothetical protein [Serratia symbiotica]MBQ0956972.1 hypothetical protein [Serratia symbiotica]